MISQERLVILSVVFTMALALSLALNPGILIPYGFALALLACVSVPYLLHTHPAYSFSPLRLILPAGIALAAPSLAKMLADNSFSLVGVFGPGVLLYACIYSEYLVVRPSAATKAQLARLILTITSYAVAISFFVLIYLVKERSLISGTLVAIISGLIALRVFTLDRRQDGRSNLYAILVALSMAEILWPLNYWVLRAALGGVVLLLCFHVLLGIMGQLLSEQLSQRVLVEYGSVATIGVMIALAISRL